LLAYKLQLRSASLFHALPPWACQLTRCAGPPLRRGPLSITGNCHQEGHWLWNGRWDWVPCS